MLDALDGLSVETANFGLQCLVEGRTTTINQAAVTFNGVDTLSKLDLRGSGAEIDAALNKIGRKFSDFTLTDNSCKAAETPLEEFEADLVFVENRVATGIQTAEKSLITEVKKDIVAIEKEIAKDEKIVEDEVVAIEKEVERDVRAIFKR